MAVLLVGWYFKSYRSVWICNGQGRDKYINNAYI